MAAEVTFIAVLYSCQDHRGDCDIMFSVVRRRSVDRFTSKAVPHPCVNVTRTRAVRPQSHLCRSARSSTLPSASMNVRNASIHDRTMSVFYGARPVPHTQQSHLHGCSEITLAGTYVVGVEGGGGEISMPRRLALPCCLEKGTCLV